MNGVLTLKAPRATRAVAVTLLWITRTLSSLLVACPLIFAIIGTGLVSGPERDAVLFRPGALVLLELLRVGAAALGSALKVSLVLAGVTLVFALIPLAAALDLLHDQRPDAFATRFARAMRLFPSFTALSAITLLGQAALIVGASLLGAGLSAALHDRDERWVTLLPLAPYALAFLACAGLGAVLDLARALTVQRELRARAALFEALASLRQDPFGVFSSWYPSITGSVFSWLSAAWWVGKIDLASPSPRAVLLAFAVHQLAIVLAVALRVRWLGAALELAARAPSARH